MIRKLQLNILFRGTMPDDLSSVPGTHMKRQSIGSKFSVDIFMCTVACVHTYMHTLTPNTYTKINLKILSVEHILKETFY